MFKKLMKSYKLLILIPVTITLLSIFIIAVNGIEKGIDIKGGSMVELKLEKPMNELELKSLFIKSLNTSDVTVLFTSPTKVTVEVGKEIDVGKLSEDLKGKATIIGCRSVGPVLSKEALAQIYWALAFAFLFMSIAVFIAFRDVVPSIAVILAAVCDIIVALGGMSILRIPLSVASVGAILMLIGYSVDTDILLTTRVLKRKRGSITSRAINAMKTGITMSITAIVSMACLYIVTMVIMPQAKTLSNIAAVLIIGIFADILCTWFMNLGIIRWYLEAKR
ncbi:SecD/SecF/SecDF export membrane protein [Methanothermus fervidus DSM 2088]|uniref:Protein-export membrane protein SecF n=1 Tax=Methanothermus fervidus (strain ATCC 43054 / DSM 2088 / JCM 10308 / V24 S) TaxID=523846 RepID=E3GWJ0_METFV|nr:protein translocase subunit SecF [Methanothermus fervidus]ADP77955.1 SecD/SecF/SecDF export membrane protein [Methanothermus fervidus DSM 2088]